MATFMSCGAQLRVDIHTHVLTIWAMHVIGDNWGQTYKLCVHISQNTYLI